MRTEQGAASALPGGEGERRTTGEGKIVGKGFWGGQLAKALVCVLPDET